MVVKRGSTSQTSSNKVFITDFFNSAQKPVKKPIKHNSKTEKSKNIPLADSIPVNSSKDTSEDASKSNKIATNDNNLKQETIATTNDSTVNDLTINISGINSSGINNSGINDIDFSNGKDYSGFAEKHGFKKQEWIDSLSNEELELLANEINTIDITWLTFLHKELTKPYFLQLKRFLKSQSHKTIFPPSSLIYSWSSLTPLPEVKCLILGQDPYHNHNQAHGLAFSVLEPTRPPPSLLNIYKALALDFPNFQIPDYKTLSKQGRPGGGNLTKWAKNGILMLNACLTVEAHKANSHSKQGWEQFTEAVIKCAINYHKLDGFVIMAWGTPAQTRINKLNQDLSNFLVIKSVHPSPLSASRGFFTAQVFKKCNEWLQSQNKSKIDWGLLDNNSIT
jgi:uracil-DNA glycosylase